MTPPLWLLAAVLTVFVALTIRWVQRIPTKPAWVSRQEQLDELTSWRSLPRPVRFIILTNWAVVFAAFMWHTALYHHYMLYAPRAPDPQSGQIYPSQFKGDTGFLTSDQMADYKRTEYVMAATIVAGFGLSLGAKVWSKRKPANRAQR